MAAKHFLHDPNTLVHASLKAAVLTNPALYLDTDSKIVYRRPSANNSSASARQSLVSLVSGGGSGHEPSFAGFVGHGLLAGAVAGTIFASPGAEQIRKCIMETVDASAGVLVVIMNYTGDVLNFGMAVEKAKASGLDVEMVIVGDDVGVGREMGGKVGRRGIAGTVLVHKIAGALAAKGGSLKDVHHVAELTARNLISIGSSLSHVHVPGHDALDPSTGLKDGDVEIGMGIHNEPGSECQQDNLVGIVKTMLSHLLDQSDTNRNYLNIAPEDETILLVNNLGGISILEMGGITTEVVEQLNRNWNIKPLQILCGSYMTSLNGLGFSITILKLADTGFDDGTTMLELLNAPAEANGWSAAVSPESWKNIPSSLTVQQPSPTVHSQSNPCNLKLDLPLTLKALKTALNRIIVAEPDITNYDTSVGDGDCGIGLKRGAEEILKLLEHQMPSGDAALFLDCIISCVERNMDGTSGAIYTIGLNALSHGLRVQQQSSPSPISTENWEKALMSSLNSLSRYTPATPGDRTLMDALYPFVETLSRTHNIHTAAQAADAGAKATIGMKPVLGRTVYVGGEAWKQIPDPGAYGLKEFLLGLSEGLR